MGTGGSLSKQYECGLDRGTAMSRIKKLWTPAEAQKDAKPSSGPCTDVNSVHRNVHHSFWPLGIHCMKTSPLQKPLPLRLANPASLTRLYGLAPAPWSTVCNKQDELPRAGVLHPRAQITQDPILASFPCLGVCLFSRPSLSRSHLSPEPCKGGTLPSSWSLSVV